jgi:hypothetical protein
VTAKARLDPFAEGFAAGRLRGLAEGTSSRGAVGLPPTIDALIDDLIALCHPDRHQGREEQAGEATRALLAWRDRGRRGR